MTRTGYNNNNLNSFLVNDIFNATLNIIYSYNNTERKVIEKDSTSDFSLDYLISILEFYFRTTLSTIKTYALRKFHLDIDKNSGIIRVHNILLLINAFY